MHRLARISSVWGVVALSSGVFMSMTTMHIDERPYHMYFTLNSPNEVVTGSICLGVTMIIASAALNFMKWVVGGNDITSSVDDN